VQTSATDSSLINELRLTAGRIEVLKRQELPTILSGLVIGEQA
jgi:hypothetical protein